MSDRARLTLFGSRWRGLLALLVWGFAGLPDFGDFHGAYGQLLNRVAVPERSTTDVVTAVNFDYRGFDTLGEEFILFAAVIGVASMLRTLRGERIRRPDDDAAGRHVPRDEPARARDRPRAGRADDPASGSTSWPTATRPRAADSRAE